MKFSKIYIGLFFPFVLSGCEIDSESLSAANVSLGGTGMPTTGGTPIKPTPMENDLFTLWTNGEIEKTCENINIKIQLKDLATDTLLTDYEGIPLDTNADSDNMIGAVITVTNLNPETTTEFLENCQFSIDISSSEDGMQLPLKQDLECISGDATILHKLNKPAVYQKSFNLPKEAKEWSFNYHHVYSFKEDASFTERKSCDISYPLIVG